MSPNMEPTTVFLYAHEEKSSISSKFRKIPWKLRNSAAWIKIPWSAENCGPYPSLWFVVQAFDYNISTTNWSNGVSL